MRENKLSYFLLLHFIVFIWGFTAILGKLITIDAIPLVWYRMVLSVIFIIMYMLVFNKKITTDYKGLLQFLGSGIIIALHWLFFFESIKVSNVSVALVIMSTGAFFTSLIEPFFYKRRINIQETILGLLVIVGLYVIFSFETQYMEGIIYALCSSFLGSLFTIFNSILVKDYKPSLISLYQLFFGALFLSCFLILSDSFSESFFIIPPSDWIYLLILSSVCTAYAFVVSIKIVKHLSPFTVMLSINLEPVYAIILAVLIFGDDEKMNSSFYYGASIILIIVLLNAVLKNKVTFKNKLKLFLNKKSD